MKMGALVLRFLATASALGLARLAKSANCYRVDGQIQDAQFGWKACNPAVAVGPCCSAGDYCLDNGICLNAGVVNNVYTVQGCTDASWGGDCRKYCAGSIGMCCTVDFCYPRNLSDADFLARPTDGNGYVTITICDESNNACCGAATCCAAGGTFKLPFFTNLTHPIDESSTSTSTTSQTSPTTSAGTGGSGGSTSQTTPPGVSSTAAANSDLALKVGVGVGVPLGVLLLAAIAYLAWESRKRKAMAEEMRTMTEQASAEKAELMAQMASSPKYHPHSPFSAYPAELAHHDVAQLPAGSERNELG